ncbi:MAG: type II secretion system F family protein [Methanonatronarchaeia archaeon]|nr:MAG: type II secretion system F family protein [Methanonatronarchaeia archaeon]
MAYALVLNVDFWYLDDILIFTFIIILMPPGLLSYFKKRKIKKMEAEFPDFLRDIAESNKSGMTLTRAVQTAAKGSYGALTPEVKKMSNQISWGISFSESLKRFSERLNTPLIKRSVSLIQEAKKAGGSVSETLEAASKDAKEVKALESKRQGEMATYIVIIYVAFFVFLGVVLVLHNSFIPIMEDVAGGGGGGGIGMIPEDFESEVYSRLFFHVSIIKGFFAGLVAGKMGEGEIVSGIKHSLILVLISYIVFTTL